MKYLNGYLNAARNISNAIQGGLSGLAQNIKNAIIRKIALSAISFIGTLVLSLLTFVMPVLVGVIIGVLIVNLFTEIIEMIIYNPSMPAVTVEQSVNQTIQDIYYNKFSEQSLYVVIDGIEEKDEYSGRAYNEFEGHIDSQYLKKLLQSGSDVYESLKLQDPDNYEQRLSLSIETLKMLDNNFNNLNGSRRLSYVMQFIKPVYATCTRDNDFEKFSECVLLNLLPVDEKGEYVDITDENSSQSALEGLRNWKEERDEWIEVHKNKKATVTDVVKEDEEMPIPEQNRTGAFSIRYNPELPDAIELSESDEVEDSSAVIWNRDGDNKTLSVSDWGLGSIAHFQAKYEPSKISNYKFKSIKVLDPDWEYGQKGAVVDVLGDHDIERYNDQTMSDNRIVVPADLNYNDKVGESVGMENVFKDYNVRNQDEGVITGYQEGDEHAYYWVTNEIVYKTNKLANPNYLIEEAPTLDNPLGTGYWRYEPYFVVPNTTLGYIIDYAVTPFGTIRFAVSQGWVTLEEVFHDQTVSKFKEFDIDIGDSPVDDQEDADEYKKITLNGYYVDGGTASEFSGSRSDETFYIDGDQNPTWIAGEEGEYEKPDTVNYYCAASDEDCVIEHENAGRSCSSTENGWTCTEKTYRTVKYCKTRGRWAFTETLDKDSKNKTSIDQVVFYDAKQGTDADAETPGYSCTVDEPSYTSNPAYVFTLKAHVQGYRKIKQTKHIDGYISSDQKDVYRYYTDYFSEYEAFVPYEEEIGYSCDTGAEGTEYVTFGTTNGCGSNPAATRAVSATKQIFEGPNNEYLAGLPWKQKIGIAKDLGFSVTDTNNDKGELILEEVKEAKIDDIDYLSFIGEDLDKYREWRTELTKDHHYKDNLGHWFDEYSGQYGVPKDLLMTIYYVEQFNDDKENVMDVPEGTYTTWNFIYGVQDEHVDRDHFVGKLEEFNTNHPEAHMADESKIHDQPERIAVKAAAMYLSNLNVKYKGNIPLVIQAYGYHDDAFDAGDTKPGHEMSAIFENYHTYSGIPQFIAIEDVTDISWLHFIQVNTDKDPVFNLEDFDKDSFLIYILQNMPTARYDFTMPVLETSIFTSPSLTAKETTTLNRFNLTDKWQNDSDLAIPLRVALYKTKRDEDYEKIWNKIVSDSIAYKDGTFVDHEGSVDTTQYLPDKATRIVSNMNAYDTGRIINAIISNSCGVDTQMNTMRDKETLQRCFSNTMGNEFNQLNSTLNIKDIFGTNWINFPIKKYTILPNSSSEDIGTRIKVKEFEDDDGLNPIMNIYKSKVHRVSQLPDGTYDVVVEIDSERSIYEYVYVEYFGLKNVEVSEGQELETGEYISIAQTDDEFTMYLEMDGEYYDMSEVFRTLEARKFGLGGIYGDFTPDFENPVWQDNPYPVGQCTWFAYGLVAQVYGVELRGCGNGSDFAACAIDKYQWSSSDPQPGALCSVSATAGRPYGHVLIVLDVMGDRMTIIHGNFQGKDDYSWDEATEENVGWQVTEVSSTEFTYGNHTKGSYTCALPSSY